ncbi:MAG: glutamate-1-semialdehyde 2,1-aminomutase [Candidatus Atribacteria bacterium]|nr:glutamate-1-semialdehyde 2,1-aminomutase [Candidatus Atribacteria bacterium]
MRSEELYKRAKKIMPGGVNSPVRAFRAVGINPLFIKKGSGSCIWDEEGREYIDYMMSWGSLILGHAHPDVVTAVKNQVESGTSFGACTELEVMMAEKIREALPAMKMMRMVSSGTEATMSAIRLARGYTGRNVIVKFMGGYHGHSDSLLVKAGSGMLTFGTPGSDGVTMGTAKDTIVAPYNDTSILKEIFTQYGEQIAAIIVEPVAGNMGTVPPKKNFLQVIRELTTTYHALLIFDEVITGFRVSYTGAQGLYDIVPDLTTLGKIVGGGLPVGVYGGKDHIMHLVSPEGPVYQAGTLSGNPLTMAAGLATLNILSENPEIYHELDKKANRLSRGLQDVMKNSGIPVVVNRVGSMMTLFFNCQEVKSYDAALKSDTDLYSEFFRAMLKQGIYFPPSQFETFFLSLAHTDENIERTIEAARNAIT